MSKQIDIYCEGSRDVGYGHIRRCLTLNELLKEHGILPVIHGLSDQAKELLGNSSNEVPSSQIAIFDSPLDIDDLLRQAKNEGKKTITLDYFGKEVPDVNIVIFEHGPIKGEAIYVGFKFQMIRHQITKLQASNTSEGVLIALGGGDLLKQGQHAARLVEMTGEQATVIRGPLYSGDKQNATYSVITQPKDFEKRLSESRWAVTNGGGCMFEAMYLGKGVVVLPQTQKELSIAEELLQRGAILGIGLGAIHIYQDDQLSQTSKLARSLIDGLGVERVSNIILENL